MPCLFSRLVQTWPILACSAAAVGWTVYMGSRHLFTSPDTISFVDRKERGQVLKNIEDRAVAWKASHFKHIAKHPEKIGIFNRIEKKFD